MRFKAMGLLAALTVFPALTAHGEPTVPRIVESSDSLSVHLDLYDGDKYSHAFSEGLRTAVGNDSRFLRVDAVSDAELRIVMNDGLSSDSDNGSDVAAYKLTLKTGAGKFIANSSGYCEVRRFDMCGRVVADDSYKLYQAFVAKHPQ